ncbi:hypothetical protein K493DRAFT_300742 [Basidiobolus meristosporus CBS 931.73]|uniref:EF-hand domain-containing protein n=1 Tax=Basidiobolus meristosporus CBS 931.73 TaxID=1314790 RepID=A0A1Y1YFG3_9FUNG|nr:hypothetical protein K493DRAFT_300742 [Basidiobolus meristosporus CBS 931.73]|eukprot:ORX96780.1 hypothetical protein K493DRAFT_300742 [Basidiobolus meristosporus CBS 931.73]
MSLYSNDLCFVSPRRKNIQPEPKTPTSLQSNLKAIFARFDHDNKGTIVAEDLFPILDLFEREQGISLLDSEPKELLNKFCQKNRDLELSADDLHRLISQLSSPLNVRTMSPKINSPSRSHVSSLGYVHPLSPLSSRRRTTPIISKTLSTRKVAATSMRRRSLSQSGFPSKLCFDKEEKRQSPHFSNYPQSITEEDGAIFYGRNRSFSDSMDSLDSPLQLRRENTLEFPKSSRHYQDAVESWRERSYEASSWISSTSEGEVSFERVKGEEFELRGDEDDDALRINRLTRITVDLNKRLRQAEKNLSSSVRQHEDRITDLQNRIDEMHDELAMKKRDIQELKGSEKTHLSQISMLEAEIFSVSKLLAQHKNLYTDLKRQCEEKRVDNEKLQQQLKSKEEELAKVEMDLLSIASEQKKVRTYLARSGLIPFLTKLSLKFQEDRMSFEKHIERLEHEVAFTQTLELEVNELREENQHLRNVVDHLRSDLNDAIKGIQTSTTKEIEVYDISPNKNLHAELAPLLLSAEQDESTNSAHYSDHDVSFGDTLSPLHKTDYFRFPISKQSSVETGRPFAHAHDSGHQWISALEQLKQAKSAIKEERRALLAEIQTLRSSMKEPVALKDMNVQCDLFERTSLLADAAIQHEGPRTKELETQTESPSTNDTSAQCNADIVDLETHQQLVEDFNKLTDQLDAQTTIINELLTLNDHQPQDKIPIATEECQSPAKYTNDTRSAGVEANTLDARSSRISKSLALILAIFILFVLSNFIYSTIPTNFGFITRATRSTPYVSEPSRTLHEPSADELNYSDLNTFKFLGHWFDIFTDDHSMVQVPT